MQTELLKMFSEMKDVVHGIDKKVDKVATLVENQAKQLDRFRDDQKDVNKDIEKKVEDLVKKYDKKIETLQGQINASNVKIAKYVGIATVIVTIVWELVIKKIF